MSGEAMTQGEMDALRAVMAEATPGPWQADFGGYHFSSLANGYEDIGECIEERNGQALVAAMNSVPRLLDEVAHLRRGIEAYRRHQKSDVAWAVECECESTNHVHDIVALRDEMKAACRQVSAWEREDAKRRESGDER